MVNSSLNGVSTSLQTLECDFFELTAGNNPLVNIFQATQTILLTTPPSNLTLTLPSNISPGRIEMQCRGIVAGSFSTPAKVAFNYAPANRSLLNATDYFIFTSDDLDDLEIDVTAASGTIAATVWEPLNFFSAQQTTVSSGAVGQFAFHDAYAGEYIVAIEGNGTYSVDARRNGIAARRLANMVTSVTRQLPRPAFIPSLPQMPIMQIMDVSTEGCWVTVKAENIPMTKLELYLDGVHVGNNWGNPNDDGMYEIFMITKQGGEKEVMVKAMDGTTTMMEMRTTATVNCSPSAVSLQSTTADNPPTRILMLVILLTLTTIVMQRRHKRVV